MMKLLSASAVAAILLVAAIGSAGRADAANPVADPLLCTPEVASAAPAEDAQGQDGPDGDCENQDDPAGADQPGESPDQTAQIGQTTSDDIGQQGGDGQQGESGGHGAQQNGEFEGDN